MSHRNARLTPRGRQLLVERVRVQGMPVAHVARAMGISRQCAHRWVRALRRGGPGRARGPLEPSASLTSGHRAPPGSQGPRAPGANSAAGRPTSLGADRGARAHGRHGSCAGTGCPGSPECDPMTGEVIRASRSTARRYERDRPGELVHVDVKKLGRIPKGGGWRAQGLVVQDHRSKGRGTGVGYDYVHSMVDDHCTLRLLRGPRRRDRGELRGIPHPGRGGLRGPPASRRIEEVMTDNAKNYTRSRLDFKSALAELGASPRAHPAPLSLAERQGRETQPHPPDRVGLPASLHGPMPNAPVLWQHGSGATTPSAPTVLLGDDRRSVGCHEPVGRVQLASSRASLCVCTRWLRVRDDLEDLVAPEHTVVVPPGDLRQNSQFHQSLYSGVRSGIRDPGQGHGDPDVQYGISDQITRKSDGRTTTTGMLKCVKKALSSLRADLKWSSTLHRLWLEQPPQRMRPTDRSLLFR